MERKLNDGGCKRIWERGFFGFPMSDSGAMLSLKLALFNARTTIHLKWLISEFVGFAIIKNMRVFGLLLYQIGTRYIRSSSVTVYFDNAGSHNYSE